MLKHCTQNNRILVICGLLSLGACTQDSRARSGMTQLEVAVTLPVATRSNLMLLNDATTTVRDLSFALRVSNGKDWDYSENVTYGQSLLIEPPGLSHLNFLAI